MNARDPTSIEPPGAPSPFEKATLTTSNGRASSAIGTSEGGRGVPEPRAVEEGRELEVPRQGGDRQALDDGPDDAAGPVVGVLDVDDRRRRLEHVAARLPRGEHVVRR